MNDIFENTETMKENEHPRFYTAESVMRGTVDSYGIVAYCGDRRSPLLSDISYKGTNN